MYNFFFQTIFIYLESIITLLEFVFKKYTKRWKGEKIRKIYVC